MVEDVYLTKSVAVVVPAYKEETQIRAVIETMPDFVDHIIVVDDCSPAPDQTREIVKSLSASDSRVELVARTENGGVGAAIESGYQRAHDLNVAVTCVMAGDGQMDPGDLDRIVHPVATMRADYSKANRLTLDSGWDEVPRTRLVGNLVLSFLTRFATGYWTLGDAQTGYTAASHQLLGKFLRRGIYPKYGVPNDLLITCCLAGARVIDVPTKPRYAVGEQSKLRPRKVALPIAILLLKGFFKRMFIRYFVIEANPVPLAYLAGALTFIIGTIWSLVLVIRSVDGATTPVEVVAASLLFMGGMIMLVLAVVLDVLFSMAMLRRGELATDSATGDEVAGSGS